MLWTGPGFLLNSSWVSFVVRHRSPYPRVFLLSLGSSLLGPLLVSGANNGLHLDRCASNYIEWRCGYRRRYKGCWLDGMNTIGACCEIEICIHWCGRISLGTYIFSLPGVTAFSIPRPALSLLYLALCGCVSVWHRALHVNILLAFALSVS